MPLRKVHFHLVDYNDSWPSIGEEWSRLFAQCPRPCNVYHPVFLSAAAGLPAEKKPSHLVLGREAGRLVLGLPVQAVTYPLGIRELRLWGLPGFSHLAPLDASPDRQATAALLQTGRRLGVGLWSGSWAAPDLIQALGSQAKTRSVILLQPREQEHPVMELPNQPDKLLPSFPSRNLRAQLPSAWRRAERDGLVLRTVTGNSDDYTLTEALENLFRLHKLRRQSLGKDSDFLVPWLQEFHRQACREAERYPGCLCFHELLHQGKVIASAYGFRSPGYFASYQSGWDPEYARYSPMNLVDYRTLLWLVEQRIPLFCFGGGYRANDYKHRWASARVQDVEFQAGCSTLGRACVMLRRLRRSTWRPGGAAGASLSLAGQD
ncbi:MAG: GNAT family N-acetyltransferase [Armatimonadetes bacterium]|jgi:CelD/BcsL family acetyltransferase involved in cellulose biosynthesis|nr:GNAT family N-acetyltransferase [Armatimonadota bacterium]